MIEISSLLAKGFLVFSDAIIISPLLIIGFITRGGFFVRSQAREGSVIWGNASLLVLFTMIFNVFLKSLFLVPLNPALGIKGYAFPSGHMQVAVVFYGWLAMAYANRILQGIVVIILTGIGYGLVQQGYHNLLDVLGAVGFGMATLYIFVKATPYISQENPLLLSYYVISIGTLLVGGIVVRIGASPHVLRTFAGLVAFSLVWGILNQTVWKLR
jgi:membrane-associated phospholipid phosphatase